MTNIIRTSDIFYSFCKIFQMIEFSFSLYIGDIKIFLLLTHFFEFCRHDVKIISFIRRPMQRFEKRRQLFENLQ